MQADLYTQLVDQLQQLSQSPDIRVDQRPFESIYRENKLTLRCYEPTTKRRKTINLLLVYALVNRPYIVDLEPGRSLLERLLDLGYRVYLIDWGYPDSTDRTHHFNDYVSGYLDRCVMQACLHAEIDRIHLLGICQGGTMSLCHSALYPEHVASLVTLVTPVDFHAGNNQLTEWIEETDLQAFADAFGNVSGDMVTRMFKNMKPFLLNREKYRQLSRNLSNLEQLTTFLKMEHWIHDSPDLSGVMVEEYGKKLYQDNALHLGELQLGDREVRLENIRCPVMNVFAEQDHIVPPDSSRALSSHIAPELYQEVCFPGGHIGVFTSQKSVQKLADTVFNWHKQITF